MNMACTASQSRRADEDARCRGLAAAYVAALRDGEPAAAADVLATGLSAGIPPVRLLDCVVTPAMHEIGRLWERAEITVADEHVATAITHRALARVYPAMLHALPGSRSRVVLAGVEGERHGLGARIVADVLEGAGHDVVDLGTDVPHDALIDAVERHAPAAVGLSATLAESAAPMVRAIRAIHALGTGAVVLVGGQAVPWALRADSRVTYRASAEAALVALRGLDAASPVHALASGRQTRQAGGHGDEPAGPEAQLARSTEAAAGAADEARRLARAAYRYRDLAYRDSLTGVWNRRALDDRLAELSRRGEAVPPVVLVDVDHFKEVNDVHGHEAGDRLLATVSRRIRESVRTGDFVARYGGDEFAVVLMGASADEAIAVAERIRGSVEAAVDIPVTLSVGVSTSGGDRRLALMAADRALYDAKRSGRNRVVS
jgi:diguanylate cyclase (GGDEF)-like protein